MDQKFGVVSEFEPDDLQKVPGCVRIRARFGATGDLSPDRGAQHHTHDAALPDMGGLRGGCQGWYPWVE
jgi:hypothetical protein